LLADHLDDDAKALELSEAFMKTKISDLDNDWGLNGDEIDVILSELPSD
jgi:hypothetical protein